MGNRSMSFRALFADAEQRSRPVDALEPRYAARKSCSSITSQYGRSAALFDACYAPPYNRRVRCDEQQWLAQAPLPVRPSPLDARTQI
jgi:hypothetical protein